MRKRSVKRDQDEAFFDALASLYGNISAACEASGMARSEAYRRALRDETFAEALRDARLYGFMALEDEALRRAVQGTVKPVFYQGEQRGETREFSDSLLALLLKGNMPEKYGDRRTLEHCGSVAASSAMSPAEATEELLRAHGMDE